MMWASNADGSDMMVVSARPNNLSMELSVVESLIYFIHTLALTPKKTLFELCESKMNLSDLEVPPPQQLQISSAEASDKDANVGHLLPVLTTLIPSQFLSLRLLNKRSRVRLSPEPLDLQSLPGKCQLFAVANSKGWFVASIRHANSDICTSMPSLCKLI